MMVRSVRALPFFAAPPFQQSIRAELNKRLTDFPVVPERIDDATDAPLIGLVFNPPNNLGARGDSLREDGVGIVYEKDHVRGRSAERFGTEVLVFGRLVSKPEIRSSY